ncbi:MAG: 16S rRNA (guanine(966)-N(2))-methyltransferase RsmD [Deltaproteobacteria bacterium]|nr:16S rRNA (guanine(966)-N(2))-methyltransferase RsmD [Deltaproteobacteria bacterium]
MRIIGGRFRGRVLQAPKGLATRPMIARVRESVFNILGRRVEGARVADLFAGTGAIGFEALSRGAEHVDAFEAARPARAALLANARALGVAGTHTLHGGELPGSIVAGPPWDLVFIDPPWGRDLGAPAAERVVAVGRLAEGGLIVVEERFGQEGDAASWRERGLRVVDQRRYGDSGVVMVAP